ncbi:MAG TPA: hypothetical protein VJ741_06235 [Solirubrobacteraceae bacterium]|nr:hypothetical protein [Solirubrobacteraceae bacterium]
MDLAIKLDVDVHRRAVEQVRRVAPLTQLVAHENHQLLVGHLRDLPLDVGRGNGAIDEEGPGGGVQLVGRAVGQLDAQLERDDQGVASLELLDPLLPGLVSGVGRLPGIAQELRGIAEPRAGRDSFHAHHLRKDIPARGSRRGMPSLEQFAQ